MEKYRDSIVTERHYYFYLICLRNFIGSANKVFKLGRTSDVCKRFMAYPKGSVLLYLCRVKDGYHVEYEMIKMFVKMFNRKLDLGLEYFKGNIVDLIKCADSVIDFMGQRMADDFLSIRARYQNHLKFKLNFDDVIDIEDYEFIFNTVDPEDIKVVESELKDQSTQINTKKIMRNRLKTYNFKEGLLICDDIDELTYDKLTADYTKDPLSLTEDQLYSLERYLYKKYWGVECLDEVFLDSWYRKTIVLLNLRHIINGKVDGLVSFDTYKNKELKQYNSRSLEQRHELCEMLKDLISTMGFDLDNIGKGCIISREVFEVNIVNCIESCKMFIDRGKEFRTIKTFVGFVNSLLQDYGLCVRYRRKADVMSYYLDYYLDIKKYV